MRMISADDLEQALRETGLMEVIKDECSKCTSAWGVPIVDAEPVVRCKDCRHKGRAINIVDHTSHYVCIFSTMPINDNQYCSYGERKKWMR